MIHKQLNIYDKKIKELEQELVVTGLFITNLKAAREKAIVEFMESYLEKQT